MEEATDAPRSIHYNAQLEGILASEGERCLCWTVLHAKSEGHYNRLNDWAVIPVIVLSTVAGTASIGAPSLFGGNQYAGVGIGAISLLAGVMNTVAAYFSFAKKAEAHRIAGIVFGKIHRLIKTELSLPRNERAPAAALLKSVRDQTDRLNEISPQPPQVVIDDFNKRFHDNVEISKPELTNGLDAILVFRGEDRPSSPVAPPDAPSSPRLRVGVQV